MASARKSFPEAATRLTFAYIPKGPLGTPSKETNAQFWADVDTLPEKACRLSEIGTGWLGGDSSSTLQLTEFLSSTNISTTLHAVVDLCGSEEDVFNRMNPRHVTTYVWLVEKML